MDDRHETKLKLHVLTGQMNYNLECFGDFLAEREGYQVHEGMDAILFYLVKTYGWLPAQVKSMSLEDLRFMLDEEMHGWVLPKSARPLRDAAE
jgi:hypothetical protein